ncbi:MAG: TolC family protein, partial [Planctomycetaceae bacterium]|nr:TolC family protein [Planctomycetaceae bacterium]
MKDHPSVKVRGFGLALSTVLIMGCATHTASVQDASTVKVVLAPAPDKSALQNTEQVLAESKAQIVQTGAETTAQELTDGTHSELVLEHPPFSQTLGELEMLAVDQNPQLMKLYQEYNAASARSHYVNKLPDPKLGANVFGDPIQTASGSQRAVLSASQAIPLLGKLNAEEQRACFEAFAVRADYLSERLRVIAAVRIGWYRLYVIDQQIQTATANQELL